MFVLIYLQIVYNIFTEPGLLPPLFLNLKEFILSICNSHY
jgi:hypothetical protein